MSRPKGSKNKSTLQKLGLISPDAMLKPQEVKPDTRTDEEILGIITSRFDVYWDMVKGAINGDVTSLIVSGSAGVGKSYTAQIAVEKAQEKNPNIRAFFVRGTISGIDLYSLAYRYNDEKNVIVLDDADRVFDEEQSLNILKSLLDTSATRRVTWMTDHPRFKGEDALPKEFNYKGSIIFLTNKNFQLFLDAQTGKHLEHMEALMSRSLYLDLKMHSRREVMIWIKHLISHNKMLETIGLTAEQSKIALEWLHANIENLRELSIRTALKIGRLMLMNPNHWENAAKVTLLRNA